MKKTTRLFWELACQYNDASAMLWTASPVANCYFNPCMFLLRHTLELQIKGLIVQYSDEDDIRKINAFTQEKGRKKPTTIDNVHSLDVLWKTLKLRMGNYPLPHLFADEEITRIDKVIGFLEKIDHDATHFRYPISKRGETTPMNPVKISEALDICPELKSFPPTIMFTENSFRQIKSGEKEIKMALESFEAIEMLFGFFDCKQ